MVTTDGTVVAVGPNEAGCPVDPADTALKLVACVLDSPDADPRVRGANPRRTAPNLRVVPVAADAGVVEVGLAGIDCDGELVGAAAF